MICFKKKIVEYILFRILTANCKVYWERERGEFEYNLWMIFQEDIWLVWEKWKNKKIVKIETSTKTKALDMDLIGTKKKIATD